MPINGEWNEQMQFDLIQIELSVSDASIREGEI